MTWFAWYVALGVPAQMALLAWGLIWWDGYQRRKGGG